jgi:tetratricopeptide (TPR) repeat protein
MLDWFSDIQSVQPDKTKVVLFLDKIASMGVTGEADEWLRFLKANLLASEKQQESQGLTILNSLSTGAKLPVLRRLSYSVIGSNHYAAARYAEAAKNWEDAVKAFPDDYESMNNLAYTYLKYLDRKADALKWAELAAANIKASADVQDTYGLALAANGRGAEALAIFRNALLLATTPQSEVTICIHLGNALLDAGNRDDAFAVADRALRTVRETPEDVTDDIKAELDTLKAKVGL